MGASPGGICFGCLTLHDALLQDKVHPQTIAVLQSRADGLGLTVEVGDESKFSVDKDVSGVLVQYPATDGSVHDYKVSQPSLTGPSPGLYDACLGWGCMAAVLQLVHLFSAPVSLNDACCTSLIYARQACRLASMNSMRHICYLAGLGVTAAGTGGLNESMK